jgi:RHS repeat-associated protein
LKNISGTESTQFLYDGLDNRLQANRNGTVTRYIYDADGNLLAETNSSNSITRYYIHGLGLLAMVTPSGQTYTYHYNAVGNTVAITDQSKNIANKYFYTPFGEVTNQQETISQPFKFAAESGIMTEPNGLCYIGNSYYDPAVGRFLSEAPLLAVVGINSYAFAGNNPLNPAIPAITPALYASGNVYKASKEGDEKNEEKDERDKGKGKKEGKKEGGDDKDPPKKWKVVIGETMKRVIEKAKKIGAKYYDARYKLPKNPTKAEIRKAIRNNYQWLRRKFKEGYEIVDIGLDPNRKKRGDFYQAEKRWLKLWGAP